MTTHPAADFLQALFQTAPPDLMVFSGVAALPVAAYQLPYATMGPNP